MNSTGIDPRQAQPPATTIALEVKAADGEVLMPVLTVLRRRGCRITDVSFTAQETSATKLRVVVQAPAQRAHCLVHWVGNLVNVHSVALMDAPSVKRGAGPSQEALQAMTGAELLVTEHEAWLANDPASAEAALAEMSRRAGQQITAPVRRAPDHGETSEALAATRLEAPRGAHTHARNATGCVLGTPEGVSASRRDVEGVGACGGHRDLGEVPSSVDSAQAV
jgi:acetolactate synthase regulatory subunit